MTRRAALPGSLGPKILVARKQKRSIAHIHSSRQGSQNVRSCLSRLQNHSTEAVGGGISIHATVVPDFKPRVLQGVNVYSWKIDLRGPLESVGAQLVREAASKRSDVAGDYTLTATVLAQSMFREGMTTVAAGDNPTARMLAVTTEFRFSPQRNRNNSPNECARDFTAR